MKQPRRVFSDKRDAFWEEMLRKYSARTLKNGESPSDYPDEAVAFETINFGWILSTDKDSGRRVLLQY